MKLKKLFILITASLLLLCQVVSADSNVLTREGAIAQAIERSTDLQSKTNMINRLERNYRETITSSRGVGDLLNLDERFRKLSRRSDNLTPEEQIEYNMLSSMFSKYMTFDERYNLELSSQLNDDNLLYSVNLNKSILDSAKNNIVISVYQAFNSLAKLDSSVSSKQGLIGNLERNLSSAQTKYKLGKTSYNDLTQISLNLKQARVELNKLLYQRNIAVLNLNKLIGEPYDKKYNEYKIDNQQNNIALKNLDESTKQALENRSDIKNATSYVELKQKQFDITKDTYYFDTNLTHKNALLELESAKNDLELLKLKVQLDVSGSYEQLENQINLVESTKQNMQVASKRYEEAQLKYKQGSVTDLVLANANTQYVLSKIQYENAKLDCEVIKLKLDSTCGLSLYK